MYKTFYGNEDAKGIGLFITKKQLEAMNGKIEVESVVGKGSNFKIYLNEKQIDIHHDDKLTVKLMSTLISINNFCEENQSFYNAQHVIEKLKASVLDDGILPDAILLDLNMPVMD